MGGLLIVQCNAACHGQQSSIYPAQCHAARCHDLGQPSMLLPTLPRQAQGRR